MKTGLNASTRTKKVFKQNVDDIKNDPYSKAEESVSIKDKMKFLEEIGKPEFIELFKDWKPRPSRRKKQAPLDQRVTVTVTDKEKVSLNIELKSIKDSGEKISGSQFIRNRALSSVDINGWKEIALEALKTLDEYESNESTMRKRKKTLASLIEDTDDEEDLALYEREVYEINTKLGMLIARNERRRNRLTGRMSLAEAETVKWRAQRLCISTSDYLRMMIFALEPNSSADAHMSLDSKRRFYISIIDVANNGWGEVPTIYNCKQCGNYLDEIERLRDRVKQLEMFS